MNTNKFMRISDIFMAYFKDRFTDGFYNQWDMGESVTLNNYRVFQKVCCDAVAFNVQSEACDSVTHIKDGQESQ